MSLIPWTDDIYPPSRYWDGSLELARNPENFIKAFIPANFHTDLEHLKLKDSGLESVFSGEKFQANIDVHQFKPEELSVKTIENTITIEGKHNEQQDEHGYISRHFVRKYVLPKFCDVNHLQSTLSSDGILTITAPKIEDAKTMAKMVPIKLVKSMRMHAEQQMYRS